MSIGLHFDPSDPGGLQFSPVSDTMFLWEFSALSTLFPGHPAVTSCTDGDTGSGPNWGGFTETRWMDPVSTTRYIGEEGPGPDSALPTGAKDQDTVTPTGPVGNTLIPTSSTSARDTEASSGTASSAQPAPTGGGPAPTTASTTTATASTTTATQSASPPPPPRPPAEVSTTSSSTLGQNNPQQDIPGQVHVSAGTISGTPVQIQVAATTAPSRTVITVLGTTVEVEVPSAGAGGKTVVTVAGTTVEVDVPGLETGGAAVVDATGTVTVGTSTGGASGRAGDGSRTTSGSRSSATGSIVVASKGTQFIARQWGSGWFLSLGIWVGIWLWLGC